MHMGIFAFCLQQQLWLMPGCKSRPGSPQNMYDMNGLWMISVLECMSTWAESLLQSSLAMMSRHGNDFCITGPLWGESTGDRLIPLTQGPVVQSFAVFFVASLTGCWTNNWVTSELRHTCDSLWCDCCNQLIHGSFEKFYNPPRIKWHGIQQ